MKMKTLARMMPILAVAAATGEASAAGFQLLEQNASGIGNAYAGSAAVAENASTIYFNPAGMTQLKDREFSAGIAVVRPSFRFANENSSAGALTSTGNGGDAGSTGFLPNLYASWALNKDLYVGLGIGAPFGLKTEYDNPWIGGAQSVRFEIKTVNINPSVAYRVNEKVSIGAGINWQRIDVDYTRVLGTNSARLGVTVPFPLNTSTGTFSANDSTWGWNAGALFTLSETTKVGVSYRSKMRYTVKGDLTVQGPYAPLNAARSGPANATVELPDVFVLSVVQQLDPRWTMMGDISWTGWSSIPHVDIINSNSGTTAQRLDTEFRDTWRMALGATYKVNDAWKAKFGVAYDQSPVEDPHRLVSLPDSNRTWYSVGGQWKTPAGSLVDFGFAYLRVNTSPIHNDQSSALRGVVDGHYNSNAFIAGAQYSLAF
ncbi:MAG TPA: outer membrane protein transport protein [Zoogloea sp.]|uniref:OmpP1/FadL family transporter n=1 Tax=Zoogloea sp. TaxID=49181 RepID=UPI002CFF55A7|nr:outer membrane protein transport protein [Zoogloea sp.]HMV16748.1 outer membrane protein transport protein [Rhodocyclaceae bacterium]HMV63007.1 outer membrane protein transport protein [Rhodocyclaceae bacterium]HMW51044.1 outer membrane protein transport protein [Rhodocyclaceae bacterium]HMY50215.1 outer membrane protein transport protein [Rhodocyclaceae bacterium]HMZ75318.1 outer membrane protein transport protein [Rhodocyclaceae bacterium]